MDLKLLRKLESLPASMQAQPRKDDEVMLVAIKMRAANVFPSNVVPRAKIGDRMFSAQVKAGDLAQLEADPAVESISISRSVQGIE